jgi:hypothetical protein
MSDDIMAMGGFTPKEGGGWKEGPEFPDVTVTLVGEDGNVFNLCGIVQRGLRRAGHDDAADTLFDELQTCKSYDEALQLFMSKVNVE